MNTVLMPFFLLSSLLFLGCTTTPEPIYAGTIVKKETKPCTKKVKKTTQKVSKKAPQKKRVVHQIKSIPSSHNDANMIKKLVSSLSTQLIENKNFSRLKNSSLAITPFVCLDDLKSTSRLSGILSENLVHEMQLRGQKVVDFKIIDKLKVDASNITKLAQELEVPYVLLGTYVTYKSGTVVNARIVNLKTDVVLSTAQVLIPTRVVKRVSTGIK